MRFGVALDLLREAAANYETAGDPVGRCRILLQRSRLLLTLGRPEEVPGLLHRAHQQIDARAEPHLYFCVLQESALAYLELDRPEEAAALIATRGQHWLEEGSSYTAALYTALQARIATACGHHDEAVAGFTAARDQLMELDRDYDAILASLDLADALLAAGRTAEAGRLALELVPMFQSRGVARETLAALRLLAEAARKEAVTAQVVARVRDRLDAAAES